MAVAFVAASAIESPGSSYSGAFNVGAGANRILIAFVRYDPGALTGITYAGVSMTQLGSATSQGNATSKIFYLLSPSSGSNTLAFVGGSGSNFRLAVAAYSGAGGVGNSGSTAFTSGMSYSRTLAIGTANSWSVTYSAQLGGTQSVSTNVTSRSINFSIGIGDSNGGLSVQPTYQQVWTSDSAATGTVPNITSQVEITEYVAPTFNAYPMHHMLQIAGGIM